jgi:hypothetical protein
MISIMVYTYILTVPLHMSHCCQLAPQAMARTADTRCNTQCIAFLCRRAASNHSQRCWPLRLLAWSGLRCRHRQLQVTRFVFKHASTHSTHAMAPWKQPGSPLAAQGSASLGQCLVAVGTSSSCQGESSPAACKHQAPSLTDAQSACVACTTPLHWVSLTQPYATAWGSRASYASFTTLNCASADAFAATPACLSGCHCSAAARKAAFRRPLCSAARLAGSPRACK